VGAVVRSADAAGASAVVVADGATDLYNPNAIRASLGTIFAVPVCAASSRETLDWLRRRRLRIFTARVDAAVPYTQLSYLEPTAIVLGSEADGLSDTWHGADMTAVSLPMRGLADSLNVSTTAAVVPVRSLAAEDRRGGRLAAMMQSLADSGLQGGALESGQVHSSYNFPARHFPANSFQRPDIVLNRREMQELVINRGL
jgi:tRNA(Leu) C34 or U34 (ribose-2'-O)-methylase TrmL